jgi:hypothetical protein
VLCQVGLHGWTIRGTARPGTYVSRCGRCGAVKVRHRITESALRRQKIFSRGRWFLAALLVSVMVWYIAVALGLTGHTKIIWGARKVKHKLDVVGSRTGYIPANVVNAAPGEDGK